MAEVCNLFFVIYPRLSCESYLKSRIVMWCVITMFVKRLTAVVFTDSAQQCLRFTGRGNPKEETYLQEVYLPRSRSGSASGYAQVSNSANSSQQFSLSLFFWIVTMRRSYFVKFVIVFSVSHCLRYGKSDSSEEI